MVVPRPAIFGPALVRRGIARKKKTRRPSSAGFDDGSASPTWLLRSPVGVDSPSRSHARRGGRRFNVFGRSR